MGNVFNPKISIVIPVYNGSDFLGEAIESALSQDYNNFEVIVINDGSTDDGKTESVAKSFGDRIRYIYKKNGGVSSALNLGIKEMTGEYFSWLSHDDKYTPYKLSHLVQLLSECDSKKVVALTSVMHIDSNNKKIKTVKHEFEHARLYSSEEVFSYMTCHQTLNGCAMLIPKDALVNAGGFNEDLRYNQDGLMWYKIFHQGYSLIADTNHHDTMYRLHPQQTSKTRRDLLLRDSYEMAKILVPMIMEYRDKKNMLINFAKKYAIYRCDNAVNECIKLGKKYKVLNVVDILYIRSTLLYGNVRQIFKYLYNFIRLR